MYKPILVMLHTGSTFLFSVMVCVIFPGQLAPSISLCCRRIRDHNYSFFNFRPVKNKSCVPMGVADSKV